MHSGFYGVPFLLRISEMNRIWTEDADKNESGYDTHC